MNRKTKKMHRSKRELSNLKRKNGRLTNTIRLKPPRNNLLSALTLLAKTESFQIKKDSSLLKLSKCSKRHGKREKRSILRRMFNSNSIHLTSIDSTKKTLRLKTKLRFKKSLRKPMLLKTPTRMIREKTSLQKLRKNLLQELSNSKKSQKVSGLQTLQKNTLKRWLNLPQRTIKLNQGPQVPPQVKKVTVKRKKKVSSYLHLHL